MADNNISFTPADVSNSNLLFRLLRKMRDSMSGLGTRISNLEQVPPPPTHQQTSQALQASGVAPLTVTGLTGKLAQPQPASAPIYTTAPTGLVLQQLGDTQLLLVGTTSTGYALNAVKGGNPNQLFQLIGGLSSTAVTSTSTNLMTLDTVQTSTGAKTLQGVWTFNANPIITSTADALIDLVIAATSTVGTSATAQLRLQNDVGLSSFIAAHTSPVAGTRYGITLGGWNEFTGWAGNGLIIGTQSSSEPIVFGTKNVEAGRFDGSQNLLLNGLLSKYHGINTAAEGVPYIVARAVVTGASTIASGTLYNTTTTGEFRLSYYILTASTGTSQVQAQYQWTDESSVKTITSTGVVTLGSINSLDFKTVPLRCASGTAILYATTLGTSTVAPLGTYNAYFILERLS